MYTQEQAVAEAIAAQNNRQLNRDEKSEKIEEACSACYSLGQRDYQRKLDMGDVLETLWKMRGHSGQQALRALEQMASQDQPTNGAECDALITRWESEWLRHPARSI